MDKITWIMYVLNNRDNLGIHNLKIAALFYYYFLCQIKRFDQEMKTVHLK